MNEEYWNGKLIGLYEALKDTTFNTNEYSWPMIPYVGPDYDKAEKKIMFVFKEPNGWGDDPYFFGEIYKQPKGIQRIISEPGKFFCEKVIPHYGSEKGGDKLPPYPNTLNRVYAFLSWIFGYKKIKEFSRDIETSERCFRSIVWTNIFKICCEERDSESTQPPYKELISLLLKIFNTLEDEIDQLKPDLIIFSTGPDYDCYLKEIFPQIQISKRDKCIAEIIGFPSKAFRTYHFKAMSYDCLEKLIKLSGLLSPKV